MIITIARKALEKNVCTTVISHSCGGINIEGSRIGTMGGRTNKGGYQSDFVGGTVDYAMGKGVESDHEPKGRFPSNVIISESVIHHLPQATQGHWANAKVTGYGDKIGTGTVEYLGVGEKDITGGSVAKYFKIIKNNQ